MMNSVGDVWLWSSFVVTVAIAFGIDLHSLAKDKSIQLPLRHALYHSLAWIMLALAYNVFFWVYLLLRHDLSFATQKGLEFFTGYLLEKSLSLDNLFVMVMIFGYLNIPLIHQRRALLWGILGAAFMRFAVIFAGTWLISSFHWLLYVFGVFILWSGIRMMFSSPEKENPAEGKFLSWLSRHVPLAPHADTGHFFIRERGRLWITPLFLALVLVEISDVIFAMDSIPAIFSVTLDPFIVFASNMFAILGLRALYFLLAHAAARFETLQYGIAAILALTGAKMLADPWFRLPVGWMLVLIVVILLTTGMMGQWRKKQT